jgi:hypothetical protein
MDRNESKAELLAILDSRDAHMTFDEAVADFPVDAINVRPPNVDYTPWHLLEHLRLTQLDILDYVRDPRYVAPEWPRDYWPAPNALAGPDEFAATVASFRADQASLRELVSDPATDPFAVIPRSPGHTIAREIRIVADHNAYHIGEFAILRQIMGTWPSRHGT